ncbi:uroporphyrinogen-III C-methyltransferase [Aquisalimonas lutea]|uniref:uroporphyrinogen-III C-methyltransferase n=1 Tax=Aquisalimonas lutea TaxID=1327750 RepID=UPI0025B3F991|nr:uroporphyrinogen-III C-methyltransferase [Aquisalimonas lutea]MDN3518592.1 uroporphyrinogen-III C-methyltransferase [Aquisalimonas lutea]
MADTMVLRLDRVGRRVLVLGDHPEAARLLEALDVPQEALAGWGQPLPAGVEAVAADPDLETAVRDSALLVVLDPDAADAEAALRHARRHRVPAWVPEQPERGDAVPAADPGRGVGRRSAAGVDDPELQEPEGQVDLPVARARGVGSVSLVGAGPGAADLITLRGLRALESADVLIYDRLVAASLLDHVPVHCERIFVGKQRRDHPVPQGQINELLLRHAGAGRRVVRLKGGDPFIFGRGGEEIEHLMDAGIPFRVIPGITAASGCAAYAGIPLTHRDHAQSCAFVTGHRKDGVLDVDFRGLVRDGQTLVFYMGLHSLPDIRRGLIAEGMRPDMPAALIQQGTTRAQAVLVDALETLPEKVDQARIQAPTLLIVGEVVRLRQRLGWFRGTGEAMAWAPREAGEGTSPPE